ncbi:hypothetical protein [Amycolatopsis plumensis]|uniref:hypothetical protein n=1 Tax=Amycolatopsis plumensis TaxID=236508 RepID=UPI00360CABA1
MKCPATSVIAAPGPPIGPFGPATATAAPTHIRAVPARAGRPGPQRPPGRCGGHAE